MEIFNFLKSNSEHRKSIRVKTNIGDKFINVKLGQTYESMDILSLKIFQKDLYRLFDADYAIIVGRVLGQGIGIPNAKVSVFIPLEEETVTSPTTLDDIKKIEATALYPYQTVFDKDGNGKIYNLLPKYSKNRNFNGFPDNIYGIGATPKTPVGTFPEKDEILVNETVAYVYEKYLKFTTVTNESGDYILTVPSNRTYNVNMSCDITDIGRFSTCAALLKLDGYPDNFFSEDGTQINQEIPLELLPNIDIQNQTISTKPLWSQNSSNTNVGINRLDFNLTKKIKPFVTVVGNQFTQNQRSWWGDLIQFRFVIGIRALCFKIYVPVIEVNITIKINGILPFFGLVLFVRKMCTLMGGKGGYEPYEFRFVYAPDICSREEAFQKLSEGMNDSIYINTHIKGDMDVKLFTIKNSVSEADAELLNSTNDNNDGIFNKHSYNTEIRLVDKTKYINYQNDGNFLILINCNRNKVITNENGDLEPVDNDSEKGVFTSFRGYFYLTNLSDVDNPPTSYRVGKIRLKVPQFFDYKDNENKWIWKHFKFDFGKIYSVAQNTLVRNSDKDGAGEAKEDFDEYSDNTGFASQTNLLLLGETGTYNNGIVPFNNHVFLNYANSYNHIVDLGSDDFTIELGDLSGGTSGDQISDQTTGPPPEFNFELGIVGGTPADSLQQTGPIPEIMMKRSKFTIPFTNEYTFDNCYAAGDDCQGFTYNNTKINITQNTGNLDVFNQSNIWDVAILIDRTIRAFKDDTLVSSFNYSNGTNTTYVSLIATQNSTTQGTIKGGQIFLTDGIRRVLCNIEFPNCSIYSNPFFGSTPKYLIQNEGYYLCKMRVRSITAFNSNPNTNHTKEQYFWLKIEVNT
jgi:hypothetical protein